MSVKLKNREKEFLNYVRKMEDFREALGLIFWDLRTGAPKSGVKQRSNVIGTLSSELFYMSTSEEMAAYIANLTGQEGISETTELTLEECKDAYNRNKKIPPTAYEEYVMLKAEAESVWEVAKETADFKLFQPYLEKLVSYNKIFIDYWGYDEHKYNTLLDHYEPGLTVKVIDKEFVWLKSVIVPLVQKISELENVKSDFLAYPIPKEKQKQFIMRVLAQIGFDSNSGRLDETVHPFATGLNPGDVRVTTRYQEDNWQMAVFGAIHEGGHALYEQNISEKLIGTPLCSGTSMGIHESQSLFYENILARDRSFWEYNYEHLKAHSSGQFDNISLNDFYKAINKVESSFIRIEADNLTYPLHIIIRYEIEKALFNDEIEVKELPEIWNAKYDEYLSIRPTNDAEGILQDVHWAMGAFGYFPSYALGYMYAAQLKSAMLKDLPNYDQLLRMGDLQPIQKWLTKKVHQYGKTKKPLELIKNATGEQLTSKYLTNYLVEKFSSIYNL